MHGHTVEEFSWGNKYVVYIDNKLVPDNFELYEKFTHEELEHFLLNHQKEQLKNQKSLLTQ